MIAGSVYVLFFLFVMKVLEISFIDEDERDIKEWI